MDYIGLASANKRKQFEQQEYVHLDSRLVEDDPGGATSIVLCHPFRWRGKCNQGDRVSSFLQAEILFNDVLGAPPLFERVNNDNNINESSPIALAIQLTGDRAVLARLHQTDHRA